MRISFSNRIMESLKKLAEVTEPDVRQNFFPALDSSSPSGMRKRTLQDFHRAAESIQLHAGVPDAIRSHFETARNLIIYSWFYFPFNVTAQLCAYTTVEFAIRTKARDFKTPFKSLLKKAVDAGQITDNGFTAVARRAKRIREENENRPPGFELPEPTLLRHYSDTLASTIPVLRNELAHGTTMLHERGASHVRLCAELINQLFPAPTSSTSTQPLS